MTGPRCSVCSAGIALVRWVDGAPEPSAAALSRQAQALGMDLSPERINTHRKHRKEEGVTAPAKTKRDAAIFIRDKMMEKLEALDAEPTEDGKDNLVILHKDFQPAVNSMLKAQSLLDSREKAQKGGGSAELAFAILRMLRGESPEPLALDDGMTIDGEAVDLGETD